MVDYCVCFYSPLNVLTDTTQPFESMNYPMDFSKPPTASYGTRIVKTNLIKLRVKRNYNTITLAHLAVCNTCAQHANSTFAHRSFAHRLGGGIRVRAYLLTILDNSHSPISSYNTI